jgi:hypothetical protein
VRPKILTATEHRDNRRGAVAGVPVGGSVRVLPVNHGSGGERGGTDGGGADDGQIVGTLLAAGPFLTCTGFNKAHHRAVQASSSVGGLSLQHC